MFKYFDLSEFDCGCCGKSEIKLEIVFMLDYARHLAGIPFKINSGYRCHEHNKKVGGKFDSSHLKGSAVDISCTTSKARYTMLKALFSVGFERIGVSENFIHVDIDKSKPKKVIWTY